MMKRDGIRIDYKYIENDEIVGKIKYNMESDDG